jgi:hypothetical protein
MYLQKLDGHQKCVTAHIIVHHHCTFTSSLIDVWITSLLTLNMVHHITVFAQIHLYNLKYTPSPMSTQLTVIKC